MKLRKRILLQLTPLLDLLITVLFVQAVLLNEMAGIAETSRAAAELARIKEEAEKAETESILQDARETSSRLKEDNAGLAKEREKLLSELEQVKNQMRAIESQQHDLENDTKQSQENLLKIAALTTDLFAMSKQTQEMLTRGMPADQAEKIKEELEQIKQEKPSQALQRLMQLDELQKRCDFWKVHINYDGMLVFSINDREQGRFPVGSDYQVQKDSLDQEVLPTEVVWKKLDDLTIGIAEPKSIVLVILSHANPERKVTKLVRAALRDFVERRNAMPNYKGRFEHSDWGYSPNEQKVTR